MAQGRVPLEWRFWSKVEVGYAGECWPWRGGFKGGQYGAFTRTHGVQVGAHRMAYELANGRPAAGHVRHLCHNTTCCNPAHLADGTAKENKQDSVAARRHVHGARHWAVKLSLTDVEAIRADERRQVDIAADYGITQAHVSHIKGGRKWRTILATSLH